MRLTRGREATATSGLFIACSKWLSFFSSNNPSFYIFTSCVGVFLFVWLFVCDYCEIEVLFHQLEIYPFFLSFHFFYFFLFNQLQLTILLLFCVFLYSFLRLCDFLFSFFFYERAGREPSTIFSRAHRRFQALHPPPPPASLPSSHIEWTQSVACIMLHQWSRWAEMQKTHFLSFSAGTCSRRAHSITRGCLWLSDFVLTYAVSRIYRLMR